MVVGGIPDRTRQQQEQLVSAHLMDEGRSHTRGEDELLLLPGILHIGLIARANRSPYDPEVVKLQGKRQGMQGDDDAGDGAEDHEQLEQTSHGER
eukprot:750132-Hanusia_phi.AAC.2